MNEMYIIVPESDVSQMSAEVAAVDVRLPIRVVSELALLTIPMLP